MRIRVGRVASALAVLFLMMSELNRLTGEVLDTEGRSWPATTLMGLGLPAREGWGAHFTGAFADARTTWMTIYLLLDIAFVLLYLWAARTAKRTSWKALAVAVTFMAGFDLLEDVLALVATRWASAPSGVASALSGVLYAATLLKTLSLVAALVTVFYRAREDTAYRRRLGRWVVGTYRQRFSVLAVVPLAVIGVMPGNDLLDQLPDVQRRWLLDGFGHAVAATIVVVLVAVSLLALGRLRSTTVWHPPTPTDDNPMRASLWLVVIMPVLVLLCWVVMLVHGSATWTQIPGLLWWPLILFVGIPMLIAAASAVIRWRHGTAGQTSGSDWFPRPSFGSPPAATKAVVARAGDIIASTAIVIAALGLVRSYTSIVALYLAGTPITAGWAAVGLLVGAVGAVDVWPVMRWVTDLVTVTDLPESATGFAATLRRIMSPALPTPSGLPARLGVLAAGVVLLLAIGLAPGWFADHVGVIGTSALALLAACLVLGGTVVLLELKLSPEVFWFKPINTPAVPVTTIIVAALFFTSTLGDDANLHGINGLVRTPPPATPTGTATGTATGAASGTATAEAPAAATTTSAALTKRWDFTTAFNHWVTATADCTHEVSSGSGSRTIAVRPMFLVAAEGGGIRAAYWTAAALDLLSTSASVPAPAGADAEADDITWAAGPPSPCASPLLAGGASGGAVGVTVARFAGQNPARDGVLKMAGPDALGQATAGLFVRDLLYAATGLPMFGTPAHELEPGSTNPVWRDRGALMEQSWATSSGLGVPFLPTTDQGRDAATSSRSGALVLNSTRVSDGCRMWISQIALSTNPDAECDSGSAPAGHTLDLFETLRTDRSAAAAGAQSRPGDLCLGPVTAATAALLASRFPFVTPSGVAGPCGDQLAQQVVDGGYVENSGIKTIVDLAPQWLALVQAHNATALQSAKPDLIVPVVIYLDNGTGTDLRAEPPQKTPELLVPQRTTGRAKASLVDTPALLREAERLISADSILPEGQDVAAVRAAVEGWRRHSVVLVHESTVPAVTAPLGWVLSQQSIQTMNRALAQQAAPAPKVESVNQAPVVSGRGRLADAIALVEPGKG
ncbi:hypothetical protein ASH01_17870 [Terrabacter sp. Soil811]|nr:hypothetical protein ASH01_17870 [Terrabacter sp. Soil811]